MSETEKFNNGRAEAWVNKMSSDESRIWLMVGIKQNGAYTFMADNTMTPLKIAERLETLAKSIREKSGQWS